MNRSQWERALIFISVIFYLFLFPHGIHGDGSARFQGLQQLLATGKPMPIVYSYVHPILSSPLLLLGNLVKDGFWWISRFNAFLFLATAFYVARQIRSRATPEEARTFLLLIFGATMFPVHTADYYSEVFSACLILVALFEFQAQRFWLVALLVSLSVWNTPGSLVGGAALLVFFAFRAKQFRYFTAIALLPAGIVLENFWKYGSFFPDAYLKVEGLHNYLPYSGGPGFIYPLFFGVLSVFFSYGKGLLFFTPGLLALFSRSSWRHGEREKELLVAGMIYLAGLILVFARWWSWSGGWFWGPRFYLFASVLAVFALLGVARDRNASLGARWLWVGSVALSVWVGCQGILYGLDFLDDCYARDPKLEFICNYVPEYSALWRVFVAQPMLHGRKWAYLIYSLLIAGTLLWRPTGALLVDLKERTKKIWLGYGISGGWRF